MSFVLLQRKHHKFPPALPFPAFSAVWQEMLQGTEAAFGMTVLWNSWNLKAQLGPLCSHPRSGRWSPSLPRRLMRR